MASWGKNKNQELGKKYEKGETKKEENYIKKGEKGLKNASFWAKKNSKKNHLWFRLHGTCFDFVKRTNWSEVICKLEVKEGDKYPDRKLKNNRTKEQKFTI